jgi:hypothetical protein
VVTAYQAATANADGFITIGGVTYPILAGAVITGANQIIAGSYFCLSATLNAQGKIVGGHDGAGS